MVYDISYVIIDTLNYELSRYALERSLERFPLNNLLLFTDEPRKWNGYDVIPIQKIGRTEDYNRVIFYELPKYLKTSYALVMQFDGYVLSGDRFQPQFLEYDYIGAAWPHHSIYNVGNGGFSLRSKKLIESISDYLLPSDLSKPEDVVICRFLRNRLEHDLNIKFADEVVASKFSYEMKSSEFETFGFHGLYNLPKVMSDDIEILLENLTPQLLVRFFRAFHNSCLQLPKVQKEKYLNFLAENASDLRRYAEKIGAN